MMNKLRRFFSLVLLATFIFGSSMSLLHAAEEEIPVDPTPTSEPEDEEPECD